MSKELLNTLKLVSKILTVALAWIVALYMAVSTIILRPDISQMVTGMMGIQT